MACRIEDLGSGPGTLKFMCPENGIGERKNVGLGLQDLRLEDFTLLLCGGHGTILRQDDP